MKLDLSLYFKNSWYSLALMPFSWRWIKDRDNGLFVHVGPVVLDIACTALVKGWVPPMYQLMREIRGYRLGVSLDCIGPRECPYLKRLILWMGPLGNIRLHKFYRSDEEEALHDHPWPFVTFPLSTYREWIEVDSKRVLNTVKRFRFHYRPAEYTHAVVVDKPGFTLVWAAHKGRSWGFWKNGIFTPWRKWFDQHPPACADVEEIKEWPVEEEHTSR
jgi:hypothetical protein